MKWIFAPVLFALAAGCGDSDTPADKSTSANADDISKKAIAAITNPPLKQEKPNPCKKVTFEEVVLIHCIADPEKHSMKTVLGPKGGAPYRGFGKFAEDVSKNKRSVAFATNGGMFNDKGQPIGYYVENGERLKKANTARGPGNFHILPNGIFFGKDGKWQVMATPKFIKTVEERPDFGTQSGPMLVIDGELHSEIAEDGESRNIRNAVGVDESGKAHFVISEMPISFGKLARFYRDKLKVGNALYLDGKVSALYNPAVARIDAGPPIGPLIVVETRAKPEPVETPEGEGGDKPIEKEDGKQE